MQYVSGTRYHNRFNVESIPWAARLYLKAYASQPPKKVQKILSVYPRRLLFTLIQKLKIKNQGTFTVRVGGHTRKCRYNALNTQFSGIYNPQYQKWGYETQSAALIEKLLERSQVFYDVGANWGYFSILAASCSHFKGKVFAFEPYPPSYRDLMVTINQLHLTASITPYPLALSDTSGYCKIKVPGSVHSGNATVYPTRKKRNAMQKNTLDALVLPQPDLIKIDVEGHESAVLEGGLQLIRRAKPMIIFENTVSYTTYSPDTFKPFGILKNLNYLFFIPLLTYAIGQHKYCFSYPIHDDVETQGNTLSLLPITESTRFLFPKQLNILACPKEALSTIESLCVNLNGP